MINIGLLVVFAVLGIGLGVGYNFLVIKNYPENRRKPNYVLTVIVFFIVTSALFSLFSVRAFVSKTVDAKSQVLEQGIKEKYPNVGFVRNGIELTKIKNDADRVIADLWTIMPSNTDLGIGSRTYNFASGLVKKELEKKIKTADNLAKKASFYADENNVMTVSSLINGIKRNIMNIVNIVILIFVAIFVIILAVHIIKSLSIVSKEKKAKA